MIEGTTEKHSKFAEEVESRDAEIFITIPCLLILKSLDEDDKQITKSFYPNMYKEGEESSRLFQKLKQDYDSGLKKMKSDYDYYNLVEKELLDVQMSEPERKMADELELSQIVHIIK